MLAKREETFDLFVEHAVVRALARRQAVDLPTLCVGETSFKRRHTYMTVIRDPENG